MAESVCRLCLEVHRMDFEIITLHTTVVLNILRLKVDLDISEEPVMCRSCARLVKIAFGFKSTCLFTEELVMSFARDQDTSHFYLKDVYKEYKNLITANDSVCRFCMTCSETSNFTSLDNMIEEGLVSKELLGLYLPEIDFNIVELMVCRSCVGSLIGYLTFATACATTEKKITKYCLQENFNGKEPVDLNNVGIICKPIKNESGILGTIKSDDVKMYKCEMCRFETKYKGNVKTHLLRHREDPEVKVYACEACPYKTKRKGDLKRHLLVHKQNFEVKMYTCKTCQYKTKRKWDLKKHLLVHRKNWKLEMYTCETCNFKTKHKTSLKSHLLVHRQSSEVEMYTCETCNHKTKYKWALKKHILVHREDYEVKMNTCDMSYLDQR